jgi:spore coat protein U-like protein
VAGSSNSARPDVRYTTESIAQPLPYFKEFEFMACLNRNKAALAGIGLLGALALGPPAVAATATATFQVTATVQATCQISAGPLAFGIYTGVLANALSTVTVTCTNTTPYNVGLDAGQATGATVTTRKMAGPSGGLLAYSLSQNDARTINWGNTVGTDTETGIGNGTAQALTVFGRVAAGQFVSPGAYADTITATLTF